MPSIPTFRVVAVVIAGLLLAPAHSIASPNGRAVPVQALFDDARHGDVFALEQALARIDDAQASRLAEARIAASKLDTEKARQLLEDLLGSERLKPEYTQMAWSILAEASFAAGDYASAADAAARSRLASETLGTTADDDAQLESVAGELARLPALEVTSFAPEPTSIRPDKVGLLRAPVSINGQRLDAVVDTGANLSVVSTSAARRLGLRVLDGVTHVRGAGSDQVPTRIGIAGQLDFAGLKATNVAFLVLDDGQLALPTVTDYRIDVIIGFPILRELKKIRFARNGWLTPEPVAASGIASNLRLVGNDLFVSASVNGRPVALHLDSGAPNSFLTDLFAARHPELTRDLARKLERVSGAGGAATRRSVALPEAELIVADEPIVLAALPIVVEQSSGSPPLFGVLGGDILNRFEYWQIDFENMHLRFGSRVDTEAASPDPLSIRSAQ